MNEPALIEAFLYLAAATALRALSEILNFAIWCSQIVMTQAHITANNLN